MAPSLPLRSISIALAFVALLLFGGISTQAGSEIALSSDAPTCHAGSSSTPLPLISVEELEATLQELYDVYADLSGFVDVYFHPNDPVQFRPLFVKAVPVDALARPTRVPVAFDTIPQEPDAYDAGAAPSVNDILCPGIRPGARIITPAGQCTLAFIFTDGVKTYASTAGHCIAVGQTANVPGVLFNIGVAVYSINQGVGRDFALIEIRADRLNLVSAEMCDYAGPTGIHQSTAGVQAHVILHTGHGGGGVGTTPPRPKQGVGIGYGAQSVSWAGYGIPGDSGSPVRIEGGGALGILTHGLGIAGVPLVGLNFGTRLTHGMALSGIPNLELVTVPYLHPV